MLSEQTLQNLINEEAAEYFEPRCLVADRTSKYLMSMHGMLLSIGYEVNLHEV